MSARLGMTPGELATWGLVAACYLVALAVVIVPTALAVADGRLPGAGP